MNTRAFSWGSFYLRWGGVISACLGFIALFLLVFAFQEQNLRPKLVFAIVGFVGAFIGYAIGKDIIDRFRNHEASADMLSNHQTRLAYIGIRLGFSLSKLILFFALASVVFFATFPVERTAFFCSGVVSKSEGSLERCIRNFLP